MVTRSTHTGDVRELRGWRADAVARETALMWELAASGANGAAAYWLVDIAHVLATSRPLRMVDGSEVWI